MKTLELTMKVVEDRSAPLMFTEKNLPGMCCCTCSCSCCFTLGDGDAGSSDISFGNGGDTEVASGKYPETRLGESGINDMDTWFPTTLKESADTTRLTTDSLIINTKKR